MKASIDFIGKDGKTYSHIVECNKNTFDYINKQIGKHSRILSFNENINSIPSLIVDLGLVKTWCFIQDIFSFKNPFRE